MGGCDSADLSQKVICCPGKIHVFVLAGVFFIFAAATGGLLYWQIPVYIEFWDKLRGQPKDNSDFNYVLMAIPGVMFLSSLCLFAMLKLNQKLLLIICIIWPVISSAAPGVCTYLFYAEYAIQDEIMKQRGSSAIDLYNEANLYIYYIVPAATAIYIISAIHCVILLVCLGCCQRGGAGRDEDLYDVEDGGDEDNEVSSKSHISIE